MPEGPVSRARSILKWRLSETPRLDHQDRGSVRPGDYSSGTARSLVNSGEGDLESGLMLDSSLDSNALPAEPLDPEPVETIQAPHPRSWIAAGALPRPRTQAVSTAAKYSNDCTV
jgi:hypothetical protein